MKKPPSRYLRDRIALVVLAGALILAIAAAIVLLPHEPPWGASVRTGTARGAVVAVYAAPLDVDGEPQPAVAGFIETTSSSPEQAFRSFVSELSERNALPGPVSIVGFERVDDRLIATVELISTSTGGATDRWYQAFQGSTGARATEIVVLWNLLQPDRIGPWPDALRLVYRGRPMEPLDHIDLWGVIARDDVRRRISAGPISTPRE